MAITLALHYESFLIHQSSIKSKIVALLCVIAFVVILWCPVHVADVHAGTSLGEPHAKHEGAVHNDPRVEQHEAIDHPTGENCASMVADITKPKIKPSQALRNAVVSFANPAPAFQLPEHTPRTTTTVPAHRASLFQQSVLIRT